MISIVTVCCVCVRFYDITIRYYWNNRLSIVYGMWCVCGVMYFSVSGKCNSVCSGEFMDDYTRYRQTRMCVSSEFFWQQGIFGEHRIFITLLSIVFSLS
jgi:hypothetical protein